MAIAIGGAANKVGPPIDVEQLEPVNINDTFRKARRNSLVWSLVLILAALGSPMPRSGDGQVDEGSATIALLPLGIVFDYWAVVVLALLIATYMFIAFRRSLHPVALMNSQRFRERGIKDIPEAMSKLSGEVATVGRKVAEVNERAAQSMSMANALEAKSHDIRTEISDIILGELRHAEHHLQSAKSVKAITDPGQAATAHTLNNALEEMRHFASLSADAVRFVAGEVDEKVEALIGKVLASREEVSAPLTDELRSVSDRLADAAEDLSTLHSAIDDLDQRYFDKFDVGATEAFFTVAVLSAAYWLLDKAAVLLTQT